MRKDKSGIPQLVSDEFRADIGDSRDTENHAFNLGIGIVTHLHFANSQVSITVFLQHALMSNAGEKDKVNLISLVFETLDSALYLCRPFDAWVILDVHNFAILPPDARCTVCA